MSQHISLEQLESALRDANPVGAVSPAAITPREEQVLERVLSALQRDPGESPATSFTHFRRWPVLLGIGSGAGVAAATAVVLLTAGSSPSVAFAGWTSEPTAPREGQLQAAEAYCGRDPAVASATPALADTRGPYTLLVYAQSGARYCLAGPGFHYRWGGPHVQGISEVNSGIVAGTIRPRVRGGAALPPPPRSSRLAEYGYMVGETGEDVSAVTLILEGGREVEASVGDGWYAAWWPGDEEAASANITASDGAHSHEQLIPPRNYETSGYRPPWEAPSTGTTGAAGASS